MASYGTYNSPGGFKLTLYGIVILAAFFVMFLIVRGMYHEHPFQPINAERAQLRKKTRMELTAKATEALNTAGWVDQNKKIVRLPVARAIELTIEAYKRPEAARSNLIARVQKASAPAPAQPAQPSPFE
jgi:hypothetical protein